jgi:hypothetical protein
MKSWKKHVAWIGLIVFNIPFLVKGVLRLAQWIGLTTAPEDAMGLLEKIEQMPWYLAMLLALLAWMAFLLYQKKDRQEVRAAEHGHEARDAPLHVRSDRIAPGLEIPWWLRDILTERQLEYLRTGERGAKILLPWAMRCPPVISFGKCPPFGTQDLKYDWDDRSIDIKFTDHLLSRMGADEAFEKLRSAELTLIAYYDLETASIKLGFGHKQTRYVMDATRDFIEEALRDPARGYSYLIKIAES